MNEQKITELPLALKITLSKGDEVREISADLVRLSCDGGFTPYSRVGSSWSDSIVKLESRMLEVKFQTGMLYESEAMRELRISYFSGVSLKAQITFPDNWQVSGNFYVSHYSIGDKGSLPMIDCVLRSAGAMDFSELQSN